MASHPAGKTAFIQADIRDPEKILADPVVERTLDLGQPVALRLVAILMLFGDDEDPQGWVRTLVEALPPGSYVAVTHPTAECTAGEVSGAVVAARHASLTL